jgi:hypothetical protein
MKDASVENMCTNMSINSTEWIIKQVDVPANKQKATLYKNMQIVAKGMSHLPIILY